MVRFDERGLVPAIVQNHATGEVLMLGYMNREALDRTIASGQVWFYSRSRQALWHKGDTSGNVLHLRGVQLDCDGDALLVQAEPAGPTCHTGEPSCFFQTMDGVGEGEGRRAKGEGAGRSPDVVAELFEVILERKRTRPEGSYVSRLLEQGVDRIGKKIGEEAAEVIIAAKNRAPDELAWEVADLWFHSLLLLAACDLAPDAVWAELEKRRGKRRDNG